ncbi:hypothetical protein ACFU99_04725 [Streptomyces sp. NPDC057654]|uniref:hypothetical protein n=1 Tax=Streptomyces sp. NPDC057654 TaxID=3346196 RepID=UPI0036B60D6C
MIRPAVHTWLRGLTVLLLALMMTAAAPHGVAGPRKPKPAAEGTDLSKHFENPLMSPPLWPVEQLRMALYQKLAAGKDDAFNQKRNGAVVFIDPSELTDEQFHALATMTNNINSHSSRMAWRVSTVEVGPLERYLNPEVVARLKANKYSRLFAVSALNIPKDGESGTPKHSERVLEELLRRLGIPREAIALGGSERRQCAACARLYLLATLLVFGHPYGRTEAEIAQLFKRIAEARERVAARGIAAQDREQGALERQSKRAEEARNGRAADQLGTDLNGVKEEMNKQLAKASTKNPELFVRALPCPAPNALSLHQPRRHGTVPPMPVLAAAVLTGDGPCPEEPEREEDAKGSRGATGLGATLTLPSMANGGIDFSTMQLRYLADPGDGSGLQYSFKAGLNPLKGDNRQSTGITAATQSSDAFFVWLSLNPSAFWVNLNPTEPDRIVDNQLGRTDAGRVMLEADLRMKKTVGELIHPHSALGRKFWPGIQGDCMSFRNWILPAPASVRQEGDKLYILDAPLDVKMEAQYLASTGKSSVRSCPQQDQATEDHNEERFRSLILPKLKHAINSAPEYAALRRVYLARVAAQWYRELSLARKTTYGHLIDSGDIGTWTTTDGWKPTDTFDRYVDSYTKGDVKVTDEITRGNTTYVRTYIYGGVDLTRIPLEKISDERFTADFAKLPQNVARSLQAPSATDGGDTVWLGSPTPRQAAGLSPSAHHVSAGAWALRLLPGLLLLVVVLLWRRRRRRNALVQRNPLRRAAAGDRGRSRGLSRRDP